MNIKKVYILAIFEKKNEAAYVGGNRHFTDVIKKSGLGELLILS